MTEPSSPRRHPRHLLWSLTLTVPPAMWMWWATGLTRCQITSCTGVNAPTVTVDQMAPMLVLSGVLLGSGFMAPWHRSTHVRLTVASVVFIGWVGWHALVLALAMV